MGMGFQADLKYENMNQSTCINWQFTSAPIVFETTYQPAMPCFFSEHGFSNSQNNLQHYEVIL